MKEIIKYLYRLYEQYPLITTDSRNIPENSIFFALKGESFNGNKFALEALKKGAKCAVVDEDYLKKENGCVFVENVLETLQELAKFHRKQLNYKIISITGTNGKTTTKELVKCVLSAKYKCMATTGNLNNHIGVPLTLLSFPKDIDFGVVEMGANHIGEIAELCTLAQPGFGLITNVGKAHLEGFGSLEGVIKAKSEMYEYQRKNDGTIFINTGDEILTSRASNIKKVGYGSKGDFVNGEVINNFPQLSVLINLGKNKIEINTNLTGSYNLQNIMAAVCIGNYFGVESELIKQAIENYHPKNNRSQIIKTKRNTIVMDAYNANPTSMDAALRNFALHPDKNKAVILGEMKELGTDSNEEHQCVFDLSNELNFKNSFFVGSGFSEVEGISSYFKRTSDLIEYLKLNPVSGKTILVKGSRGNKLERIVEFL